LEFIGALTLSLLLGLRHGLDWDHVAALADITGGSSGSKKERVKLSLWYAVGHEAVVCLLGFSIILFAWSVPVWVDHLMGKAIGITLIFMAILMLIARKRENQPNMSRGVAIIQKIRGRRGEPFKFTKGNVFAIGIIHGIGVETPTQLLLFTTLAGMTAKSHGILAVAVFSVGLLITHAFLSLASVWLHDANRKLRPYFPVTVYAASLFSFLLGLNYLI
jgi:high-affinity nickel-transport protein